MAKLIVTNAENLRREFALTRSLTIGRGATNDVNLTEVKASRAHCRILPDGDGFLIEDLDSSNGTKLNGVKITRERLRNGDMVLIGGTTLAFDDEKPLPDDGQTMVLSSDEIAEMESGKNKNRGGQDEPDGRGRARKGKTAPSAASSAAHEIFHPPSALAPAVKPASVTQRSMRTRKQPSLSDTLVKLAFLLAVLAVACIILVTVGGQKSSGTQAKANPGPKNTTALNGVPMPPISPVVPAVPEVPAVPAVPPPPVPDEPAQPAQANAVQEEIKGVLAERDRALASANYLGARAVLTHFLAAHPAGDLAERAKQELQDTDHLIDTALATALKDAHRAVASANLRSAVQLCTRLLSSDPTGRYGTEARQLLTQLDTDTEARYKEFAARADKEIAGGRLDRAAEILGEALDNLGGTKWASPISDTQLQVLLAGGLLQKLETTVASRKANGKPITLIFSNKNMEGVCASFSKMTLELFNGNASLSQNLKTIEPADFTNFVKEAGLGDRHLELANLWLCLGRKEPAQKEIDAALQNPEQASDASRLCGSGTLAKDIHAYDFSRWQQQTDWEAISGSWSTLAGRYVLESKEGGDTSLKPEALGGAFAGKTLKINFDFELQASNPGYVFSFEFGNRQKSVNLSFSNDGVTLGGNVGGENVKTAWTRAPSHVELSISGDELTASLDGTAIGKLKAGGVASLTGTVTFHVRDTTCAIDNVILRKVE